MKSRDSQLTGRLRLRHLMEHTEAVDEEMVDERSRFDRLSNNESRPRAVSSFNLFQTPEAIATKLVEALGRPGRTLEPSAGLGRLYRAVRAASPDCHVTLVENAPAICAELYRATEHDANCRLVQADFLECNADRIGTFDSIIMNPPFKMGTDIKHIRHAVTLLNPGGRLVTLCAGGPRQRANLKPLAEASGGYWEDLPAGSFASEGTNVNTAVCVIEG